MKTTDAGINSPGKRWFAILFVVAVALLAAAIASILLRQMENPIKSIDVTSLQGVSIRNPRTNVTLQLEPQRWSRIVQYFRSSSANLGVTSWPELAEIEFQFQDGRTQTVTVYDTGKEVGTFRVNNTVYTGGDERLLLQMLDDEYRRQRRELQIPRPLPR